MWSGTRNHTPATYEANSGFRTLGFPAAGTWIGRIHEETFARKHTELRDRLTSIKLQLDVVDRSHDETAESAANVFELSQTLRNQWLTAGYSAKRRILEIVFLNCVLDGVTLVRKPFDVLPKGYFLKIVEPAGHQPQLSGRNSTPAQPTSKCF